MIEMLIQFPSDIVKKKKKKKTQRKAIFLSSCFWKCIVYFLKASRRAALLSAPFTPRRGRSVHFLSPRGRLYLMTLCLVTEPASSGPVCYIWFSQFALSRSFWYSRWTRHWSSRCCCFFFLSCYLFSRCHFQDVINRMEAAFSAVDAPPKQHRLSPPYFSFCEWEIEGHLWGQAYDVMWCFFWWCSP